MVAKKLKGRGFSLAVSPGARAVIAAAILLFTLAVAWRWLWGSCWNPLETACFQGPGEGDHLQHFYGWLAYAQGEPRLVIPPVISNWSWPFNAPLLYTDAIPLAAVLLRPLARSTGLVFQYFSALSLLSILACGCCGFVIGHRRYASSYAGIALGLLLALAPPAIIRYSGHEALGLHAVIVIPFTLLILRSQAFWPWPTLLFLASGIHAYFVPLVLLLFAIRVVSSDFRPSRLAVTLFNPVLSDRPTKQAEGWISPGVLASAVDVMQATLALGMGLLLFGYGYGKFDIAPQGDIWSANILSIIDPQNQSSVFGSLQKVEPFQWEGFSYLGVAGIVFLSVGLFKALQVRNRKDPGSKEAMFPAGKLFWIIVVGAFAFALGPVVYLGSIKLLSLAGLARHLHVDIVYRLFRACGRFTWLLYYSLVLWGFDQVVRSTRRHKLFLVVVVVCLLETHIPTLAKAKLTIQSHYNHGSEWNRKANNLSAESALVQALKSGNKLINATGDPMYINKMLPKYFVQSVNPSIKTNYHPYVLARSPLGFSRYYSRDSCQIINSTKPEGRGPARQLYIASTKEVASKCGYLPLRQILLLDDGHALYSFSPRLPVTHEP